MINILCLSLFVISTLPMIYAKPSISTPKPVILSRVERCLNVSYDTMDLFVVLDGSSSINSTNFQKMLKFVQTVAQNLKIGPNDTRMGLLQYNHGFRLEFDLNRYETKNELVEAIGQIAYLEGATSTGRAIRYVAQEGFTEEKGGRPKVPHVILVITDGYSQDDVDEPAKFARSKGVEFLAVGISEWVNVDQLNEITNNQKDRVFLLESFDSLNKILGSIVKQIRRSVDKECFDEIDSSTSSSTTTTVTITESSTTTSQDTSTSSAPTSPSSPSSTATSSSMPISTDIPLTKFDPDDTIVRCQEGRMQILTQTLGQTDGWIYVKGHFDNPSCRWSLSDLRSANATHAAAQSPMVKFDQCGVQRSRSANPKGLSLHMTIVAMKHPQFLTKGDRAFDVRCFYMEADKRVTNNLDVSLLSTEHVSRTIEMPNCKYSLRSDTLNGPTMKASTIGSKVFHRWDCETSDVGSGVYGMLVHSCMVKNNDGSKQAPIINEVGCVIDKYLLGNLNYSQNLLTAYAEGAVFTFADSEFLRFDCQITLCLKQPSTGANITSCDAITPPACVNPLRGKRSPKISTYSPSEIDVSSESLLVLDEAYVDAASEALTQDISTTNSISATQTSSYTNELCLSHVTLTAGAVFIAMLSFSTVMMFSVFLSRRNRKETDRD